MFSLYHYPEGPHDPSDPYELHRYKSEPIGGVAGLDGYYMMLYMKSLTCFEHNIKSVYQLNKPYLKWLPRGSGIESLYEIFYKKHHYPEHNFINSDRF